MEARRKLPSNTVAGPGGRVTGAEQPGGPHAGLLALQRDVGNRAVGRLLKPSLPWARARPRASPEPKGWMGAPGSVHERAADRIAGTIATSYAAPPADLAGGAAEVEPPASEEGSEVEVLPAAASPGSPAGPPPDAPPLPSDVLGRIAATRGGGRVLAPHLRAFFGARLGRRFEGVRVHTDSAAADVSQELGAAAFAVGRDVYFAQGRYQPETPAGRRLLAHELVHVVQQERGQALVQRALLPGANPATAGNPEIPQPGPHPEVGAGELSTQPEGVPGDTSGKVEPSAANDCAPAQDEPYLDDDQYLWLKFPVNSSSLVKEQKQFLDDAAGAWLSSPSSQPVRVDGYASQEGNAQKNWLLSCARARSVAEELENPSNKASGVPGTSIQTFAHGETSRFSATSYGQNRVAIITGIRVRDEKGRVAIGLEKVVESGSDEYARPFLGSTIMQYVGNHYLFLTSERRYAISPTVGKAYNYGRALFGASSFGILVGELDDTGAILYFTVPLKESVSLEDLNPTPLMGGGGRDLAYDGEVYPKVGPKGQFAVIGVFLENATFLASPTLQQTKFIRAKIAAELRTGLGKIEDETVQEILAGEVFAPIDRLIQQGKTAEAADRLAELAEAAFATIDFETKATYIRTLLAAWTHQRHEKAIVEIVKSTETLLELQAMLEILGKDGLSKLLADVDYELWTLFENIGRKYGTVQPVTLDGVWKLLEGFGLLPFSSLGVDDLEQEIATMWDTFLGFLVSTWESLLLVVTQPDKILKGLGEFGKMLIMLHLATDKAVDLMAKVLGLAGIDQLQEWQTYARKYMEGLLTAFGIKIRNIMAGVEIMGVEKQVGVRLRWALIWEIASLFIGVGEVKALLTAFKAQLSLRVLSRVLRIFGIGDKASDLARYAGKLEDVAAAIGKASDVLKAEDDILKLLNYLPEQDVLRLKAVLDGLADKKITSLSELGDLGLELRKKVESLGVLGRKAGGLTSDVIEAYQRLAGNLPADDLLQIVRLVPEEKGALFAKIVNIAPLEEAGFYKMLAQSESGMKAVIELGYPTVKNIYRRTGGDADKLAEYLEAIGNLRTNLPKGARSVDLQKLFEDVGPVDLATYRKLAAEPELVRALIDNPLAAKLLKKCASPCYPPEMKKTHIQNLERALRKAEKQGIPVDQGKLTDYLYDNRDRLGKVTKELNDDPRLLENLTVRRLTADEIVESVGKALEPHRGTITELLDASFPSRELEKVLRQAAGRGDEHLGNLLKHLTTFKEPKPRQLGALLRDLAEPGRAYDEAFDFLRKMNENGLAGKFDELYLKKQEGFIIIGQRNPQGPRTGARRHDFEIRDGQIQFRDPGLSNHNTRYEFVITADGELRIGGGHYYLANDAEYIRVAGAVGLERGKFSIIYNNSGHYQPLNQELLNAIRKWMLDQEYVAKDLGFFPRAVR